MSMILPPNTHVFKINIVGEDTGQTFKGKFVYTRPTIGTKRDIIQEEYKLNSQYENPAPEVLATNYTIAYLKTCLQECPKWFKDSCFGLSLEDDNVLDSIALNIQAFEEGRIKKLEKILEQKIQKEEQDEETPSSKKSSV